MPATFRIYSSSAGSGKTYQLTKEYLKLALGSDDPSYFKSILAITFTNDAAGEMKERIIGALRKFAYPAAGPVEALLAEVAAELWDAGKLPRRLDTVAEQQQEVQRRAQETFRLVLYHYADFAVSTIDSFVQRIVTAFTRELGLPATFEVELDTDAVLQSAVAVLLDKVNRDPNSALLSKTLAEYALGKAEEGKSWNTLPDELVKFGKYLFNESVHEAVGQLQLLTMQDFRRLHEAIRKRRQEIEGAVQLAAHKALDVIGGQGLEPAQLAGGARGVYTHFANWQRWLADGDTPTATARKVAESGKWSSAAGDKEPFKSRIEAIKPTLDEAFRELEALRALHLPSYLLLSGMQPYLFHASLLSELSKIVDQLSRERNVVLISEFNRRIAGIVLTEPVPFLYERLGERYQHLLIDEFQDTSVLQWNNLLPLVENAVSNDNLSLAVGDAKQAIYRWRGGEMEQILRLHQGQTEHLYMRATDPEMQELLQQRYQGIDHRLEAVSLNTNYRSAAAIVGFNNDFFAQVSQTHAQFGLVQGIYDEGFKQEVPHPPTPANASPALPKTESAKAGHIELLFTQNDAPARRYSPAAGTYTAETLPGHREGAVLDYEESTLYLTLQLVEQALADGFALRDVAVLCRTRNSSRLVAKFLKERGYAIISADSLSLEFAEVVNLLVAVFRVLNQPADTLARAEALLLLDKVVRRLAPTPARARAIGELAKEEKAEPFFDHLRTLGYDVREHEVGNLGLYELTERLIGTFGLLGRNGESEYLFRFLDLTLEYSLRFGNNLNNFLTYWDQRKSALSINAPGGRDAITITTVHKAKGLAYGVVIVPFADWSLEPHRNTLLWGRLAEEEKPLGQMPAVAVVPLSNALTHTPLAAQYLEEREKTFLEGLNMLYVAFTRPRHRLYAIAERPRPTKASSDDAPLTAARNVSQLLHRFLMDTQQWDDEQVSFVLSEGSLNAQKPTAKAQKPDTYPLQNLSTAPWEERLRLRRHANTVFDFDEQQVRNEWNRKLHYALRRVVLAADVERVATQLVAEGLISGREKPELLARLRQVTTHPRLAHYFSPRVAVETEREILVGGVKRRDYQPDRVVFEALGGARSRAGTRVTLLDFRVPPPQDQHRRLLQEYAGLFRQLRYNEVRCVLFYFDSEEVVEF
ncbi:ATP-dependent exoDNAse (exonuclease V) beta subunit (contains helicase and exonuclease domains) [Hymenobacter daecheongensis DSM 21074]|uniref:DNA 3'-5' helicase n=1 Tax=Hymenobacter daecheongensis DSM 21074 TaxID=1121955 RepID=A0A1M6HUF3_9BACT|nr:UvrD-helicase domain-containing protein [Hymenobacter daecheongensis]SHJ25859.1 ATP-dependent exoDNAse (exonuclease V) beta subunit (contains helicase and exonuclease domains) [Hymenobacter daecheongensis DSM 21074]